MIASRNWALLLASLLLAVAGLHCGSHRLDAVGLNGSPNEQSCSRVGISPFAQTVLGPNDRSHWLQPWQSFTDTWPARRMREILSLAEPGHDPGDDRWVNLYAAGGVHRVLLGLNWHDIQYGAPDHLTPRADTSFRASLAAVVAHGLRPVIGVASARSSPCPLVAQTLTLVEPAAKGARTVHLDAASAASVVPRKTGFSDLDRKWDLDAMIVSVDQTGVANLSRPLPIDLPLGPHAAATALYEPFTKPRMNDGSVNPRFEASAAGFVLFVTSVAKIAREIVGSNAFDINVWPEYDYEAGVYTHQALYDPTTDTGPGDEPLVVAQELLTRVAAALRPTEAGIIGPTVIDGFGSLLWSRAAGNEPPFVATLDRHLSVWGTWSAHETILGSARSLDALGQPNGSLGSDGNWRESFVPNYHAYFPELSLTAILPPGTRRQYAVLRDLSANPSSDATGVTHGRTQRTDGGGPLEVSSLAFAAGFGTARGRGFTVTPADEEHLKPKVALRALAAFGGAGLSALGFYQGAPDLKLFDLTSPEGGPTFAAMSRLIAGFSGPPGPFPMRQIRLLSVQGCGGIQFLGDGSAAHPSLRDIDVVAFFPFQVDATSFVASAYVMTRDVVAVVNQNASADDPIRFDLPPKEYRLNVKGVGSTNLTVTAFDPLLNKQVEVKVINRSADEWTIEVALTDTPRLIKWMRPQ